MQIFDLTRLKLNIFNAMIYARAFPARLSEIRFRESFFNFAITNAALLSFIVTRAIKIISQ
jgi:hypothetical protein